MMFKILFEDEYFLVAEKPSGLPSQPTVDKRRPDFFTQLKKQLTEERGPNYLGLHHRLDRDTSGLMIFAKVKEANEPLANLFKKHLIQKTYLCFTKKQKCPDAWEVKNHLAETRDAELKKMKMHSVRSGGVKAHTLFKKLQEFPKALLVEAKPLTGRMHQIRVHLAEQGLGIYGDDIYAAPKKPAPPRLMLHALRLEFTHPFNQEKMNIECPLPPDMEDFQKSLS
ncbi:RluA family pseudouridine synthase [Bdellovibrio reynosensis]|uniref:RNA pseudouridine synthase n=1 Tax=Bdellovibrio reynosensis TaxID=2835041 RepID=A0ABY4CBS9_9BACT|nr:RNA pseudouridine synthase [Bdellovibrio reynosensis]UOF02169.1 RNA pseudouridine synthase [Bdellovibrio reynosensis]